MKSIDILERKSVYLEEEEEYDLEEDDSHAYWDLKESSCNAPPKDPWNKNKYKPRLKKINTSMNANYIQHMRITKITTED